MAIDTAEKRRSISGTGTGIPGVTPNSSKDAEWRAQSAWNYSGITLQQFIVTVVQEIELIGTRLLTQSLIATRTLTQSITAIRTLTKNLIGRDL